MVANTETTYDVKAVMLELEPQEYEGVFQQSDFKLIMTRARSGRLHHYGRPVPCPISQWNEALQGDRRCHLPG